MGTTNDWFCVAIITAASPIIVPLGRFRYKMALKTTFLEDVLVGAIMGFAIVFQWRALDWPLVLITIALMALLAVAFVRFRRRTALPKRISS
jgi:hypothetical protein